MQTDPFNWCQNMQVNYLVCFIGDGGVQTDPFNWSQNIFMFYWGQVNADRIKLVSEHVSKLS